MSKLENELPTHEAASEKQTTSLLDSPYNEAALAELELWGRESSDVVWHERHRNRAVVVFSTCPAVKDGDSEFCFHLLAETNGVWQGVATETRDPELQALLGGTGTEAVVALYRCEQTSNSGSFCRCVLAVWPRKIG